MKNKYFVIIIFFIFIALLALLVWNVPVIFKGYSNEILSYSAILAKNYSISNFYGAENGMGVLLNSDSVKDQAITSSYGSKLTVLAYSLIFKYLYMPKDIEGLTFLSSFLYLLSFLVFTIIVWRKFGFSKALIFSLIYIFFPVNWLLAHQTIEYEFGLLAIAFFLLFFLKDEESRYRNFNLAISGIFLAMAGLFIESLFLIAPLIFLYLFFSKKRKDIVYIFLPFLIILFIYLGSFYLLEGGINNMYLDKFFKSSDKAGYYGFYGHIYPDPYIFNFEREEFDKQYLREISDEDFISRLIATKEAANKQVLGGINLITRFLVGLILLIGHLGYLLSLEEFGGPLVFVLFVIGLIHLFRADKKLFRLSVFWILGIILLLSFITLNSRSHLMDYNFLLVLAITLGLFIISNALSKFFNLKIKFNKILPFVLCLFLLYHLVLVAHINFGNKYDKKDSLIVRAYSHSVEEKSVNATEVIVSGYKPVIYDLNFKKDQSIVYFSSETIRRLLTDNRLAEVFNIYNIKYILGYSDDLTNQIIERAKVTNIATRSIEIEAPKIEGDQSWILNILR